MKKFLIGFFIFTGILLVSSVALAKISGPLVIHVTNLTPAKKSLQLLGSEINAGYWLSQPPISVNFPSSVIIMAVPSSSQFKGSFTYLFSGTPGPFCTISFNVQQQNYNVTADKNVMNCQVVKGVESEFWVKVW
jgi:hypothetical protein